jgi:hypothetical protein
MRMEKQPREGNGTQRTLKTTKRPERMAKICNKRLLCFQFQKKPCHAPILEAGIDSILFVATGAVAKIGALTTRPPNQSIL